VLDLTDGDAELASFVLAGMGADVIKVEPPGGSTSREVPPYAGAGGASLHFEAYNRGKRSIVLDLEEPQGRTDVLTLAATADFVFENAGPGVMDAMDLGYGDFVAVRPDIVYVAVSPFGQTGPYANHVATDLTLAAMGGSMALCGDRDRRPVRITVPQTWHHASAEAALAALVAHYRRCDSGEAQFVDVSVQAAVFWTGLNAMISSAINGQNIERGGTALQLSTVTAELVYPSSDGEVCMFFMGATLLGLVPWMLETGTVTQEWAEGEDWTTFERRVLSKAPTNYHVDELRAKITEFTQAHTKAQLFAGSVARGITIVPVNTAADTMAMEHLQVRDYWDEITIASGQVLQAPGSYAKVSNQPIRWERHAPGIGEHSEEIMESVPPSAAAPAPATRVIGERRLPLEGVKVADFSWIGVGPITAKSLADHGATVVHIESEARPDRLRLVGPFTNGEPGINRCQFFGSFNTSKLSIHLDLKNPAGNDVAKKLLAWCDIALDSFTAGTMSRLGLGYEQAIETNPEIIMATTCLFGQYGPASALAGYGYHAAAISGFYEMTGWDDRRPGGPWNAYTDTIAPRFLTSTLLAALDHRRRTGQGQFIDQAQMESALHFQAPQLLDVQLSGESARRSGNDHASCSPHDSFPCLGDDQWCAIAVENDEQWIQLQSVMGNPSWASAVAYASADGRRAGRKEIYDHLAEFTSRFDRYELMAMLQAAGVPAGVVQRSSDHLADPQLAHRNFFRPMVHPEMGEVPYEGHQYIIEGYNNGPRMPAPCLGEHTFDVLTEILGLTVEEATDVLISGGAG